MKKEIGFFKRIYCYLCRVVLYIGIRMMFRPRVRYVDKKAVKEYKKKPAIFICNHTTLYDGLFAFAMFDDYKCHVLTAKDWYEKPHIRTIFEGNRIVPIDRNGLDTSWLRTCVKLIKAGESVCIFPEGHRSTTGDLDEFKSGFTLLAQMSGAPVIPVFLSGEYSKFIGPRKNLLFGKPEMLSEQGDRIPADYLNEESERFRQIMRDLGKKSKECFGERACAATTDKKVETA
ncbi:MAG: 1-acyl-sn-glycerol-3-phosphate acyltransferase [Lachnospiraceae bacterium]|nr:1-acyl-sn-glycerol-3-phosphate acyltransferase [Lachnospiraceae bacterium]